MRRLREMGTSQVLTELVSAHTPGQRRGLRWLEKNHHQIEDVVAEREGTTHQKPWTLEDGAQKEHKRRKLSKKKDDAALVMKAHETYTCTHNKSGIFRSRRNQKKQVM